MTIIIAAAGADGAFLAADSKVSSAIDAPDKMKKKLVILDGPVLAASGGYANGVSDNLLPFVHEAQRRRPDECPTTTDFVDHWLGQVGRHLAAAGDAMAEGVKVEAVGLYTIAAGLDKSGQFNWRFTDHSTGKRESGEPGTFFIMATDTGRAREIAAPINNRFLGQPGPVPADVWVSHVVAATARIFPESIGFPVHIGMVRGAGTGCAHQIDSVRETGRPEFLLDM